MWNIKVNLKNDMNYTLSSTHFEKDYNYLYFYDKNDYLISSIDIDFVSNIYAWKFVFIEENKQRIAKKETIKMYEGGKILCQKL